MAHKTKVGGTAYEIKGGKALVGGTGYSIKKGRTLVGGTGYDINFVNGTPVGDLAVGTSIYANVDGVKTEFIVVHQGNPSTSLYDSSCNGVWLMMKDLYELREWSGTTGYDYSASTIHTYLNGTFLALLDADIQEAIKAVKIPYSRGGTVISGASGLSAKIFLLSRGEVFNVASYDGARLEYFADGASSKRIAYMSSAAESYAGEKYFWWLRTPDSGSQSNVCDINKLGSVAVSSYSNKLGIRPTFIVDSATIINPETYEVIGL